MNKPMLSIIRQGKAAEAFRAFRKIYLEIIDQLIDHLRRKDTDDSARGYRCGLLSSSRHSRPMALFSGSPEPEGRFEICRSLKRYIMF
jgi:hypothetical protein